MKYIVIITVFLAVVSCYLNFKVDTLEKDNKRLEAEKKALVINNERLVKNEVELRKQKAEVKKAVEAERLNFDWSFNLSNSSVRKRMSDNCLSCKR